MNVTLPNIRWGLLYGLILTNAVSNVGVEKTQKQTRHMPMHRRGSPLHCLLQSQVPRRTLNSLARAQADTWLLCYVCSPAARHGRVWRGGGDQRQHHWADADADAVCGVGVQGGFTFTHRLRGCALGKSESSQLTAQPRSNQS